jgi:hypothetical protein
LSDVILDDSLMEGEVERTPSGGKQLLEKITELLAGDRKERFQYEWGIQIFQFQSWAFVPSARTIMWAGQIAATKVMRSIEIEEYLPLYKGEPQYDDYPPTTLERIIQLQEKNPTYRRVFDRFIAPCGGLASLLEAPRPAGFDGMIAKYQEKAKLVTNLVDYRLRYAAQDEVVVARGATVDRAIFFNYWPTHHIPGKRGVTVKNKSVSPKTMQKAWNEWEHSAIFVYLQEKHGFRVLPPKADAFAEEFADSVRLSGSAERMDEMRRLLGAYAYIAETICRTTKEEPYIAVPLDLPRVTISVPPFSCEEKKTIAQYNEHKLDMWQ